MKSSRITDKVEHCRRFGRWHRRKSGQAERDGGLSNEWHVVLSKSFQDIEFGFGPWLVQ